MKNLTILLFLLLVGTQLNAQKTPTVTPPPPRVVDFTATPKGNSYQFRPIPPPLQQIAGAPQAFWTYYWEFGDGSFSFEDNPVHIYERDGNYNTLLEATAHYDDGDRPKGRAMMIRAEFSGIQAGGLPTVFDSTRLPIQMKPSRQARALEELVCILSYRNLGTIKTDGRLHFFFNEKRFAASHFAIDSGRVHFSEKVDAAVSQALPEDIIPTQDWTVLNLPSHTGVSTCLSGEYPPFTILQNLLNSARGDYREEKIWRFTNLKPGEKRNLFVALRGTDKMLQDTNAFIHVEAIFAPFDPLVPPEQFELEFEIVSSHDPNAILVSDSRVSYRAIGSKKLDYKVQFQNNGEGPASTVEVKVEIPEGLDMKRMRPLEWYPKCAVCPKPLTHKSCLDTTSTKEGLVFTFRNIYLPGSHQKNVNSRDSTKGFVRYRIEAEEDMPKRSFRSRAKITFDKNKPIYTNFTRTRFKTGISPGLKVGYGFEPNFDALGTQSGETDENFAQNGYFFFGASLSPYKSWQWYPQLELLTGIKGRGNPQETNFIDVTSAGSPNPGMDSLLIDIQDTVIVQGTQLVKSGFVSFEVPFLLRKNFCKWFGAGIGGSARIIIDSGEMSTSVSIDSIQYSVQDIPGGIMLVRNITHDETENVVTTFSEANFRYTVFGDLTFLSVRKGVNLGLRAGAVMGRKKKVVPFAQLSLEMKL